MMITVDDRAYEQRLHDVGKREEAAHKQADTLAARQRAVEQDERRVDAMRRRLNADQSAFDKEAEAVRATCRRYSGIPTAALDKMRRIYMLAPTGWHVHLYWSMKMHEQPQPVLEAGHS